MKKILSIIFIFALVINFAYAAQPTKAKTAVTERGSVLALSSGNTVYSLSVTGVAAGDWVAFYDVDADMVSVMDKLPIRDIKVGTANDTKEISFGDRGVNLNNGLYGWTSDKDALNRIVWSFVRD